MKSPRKEFHCKEFSLYHGSSSMPVGTDAMVIGAWTEVKSDAKILDIGCGSGIISLLIISRSNKNSQLTAIDIHENSVLEAQTNFMRSNYSNQLKAIHCSLQEFKAQSSYDLIISNPPYFYEGPKPKAQDRSDARHVSKLSPESLLKYSYPILAESGSLAIIVPYELKNKLLKSASELGFHLGRLCTFSSKPDNEPHRVLLQWYKNERKSLETDHLIQYDENGKWHPSYQKTVGPFHLIN